MEDASFASSNSDNEWSITDCLDIYLNNKLESKGTLYGHIDGDDDFRSFINKLKDQGLSVTEMPEEPKLVNKPADSTPEIEVVDSENAKFMFDWKAGSEYVTYGSPFFFSEEKAVFCRFKSSIFNNRTGKYPEYTVKFYVKVMKLYENYKILRENPKISDKRKMVMILKYALESQVPPPMPVTRFIIGVPLYARLQVEGKGNVVSPPKRRVQKVNEYGEKIPSKRRTKIKTETDENVLKDRKDEIELKSGGNCHWSDSTDIIIPSALSNKNNPMLNKRDTPQKSSLVGRSVTNSSNCRKAIKFNEPILSAGTLASSLPPPRDSSIGDAQSLMHAASCLVNDLPLLLNENELDINPNTNIELHSVPNLDIHTGASIELQTEQNLLTPLHNPNFNLQISPNFHLDTSPAVSITSSPATPVSTNKKDRKKQKKARLKEKTEIENKSRKAAPPVKVTDAATLVLNQEQSMSRNNISTTPICSLNSEIEGNDSKNVSRLRKKPTVKVIHTLEEIVKAQEQLRSKLKSIHDMSFRCDNVELLEEIVTNLKGLSDTLKSSLPPAKPRRRK